jgi:hypothetical protein
MLTWRNMTLGIPFLILWVGPIWLLTLLFPPISLSWVALAWLLTLGIYVVDIFYWIAGVCPPFARFLQWTAGKD